ncbi:hypothetical protein GCM10011514_54650 [Emticicia aquatilis]|uniref:Uncharacterized protein n=1 Tax=Emticicia aquatilis TaxID=1537369 RepID=A0A916ZA38_9BACT|nr:hypothetical protein [Emticicia aquatilis]GGD83663.1 hypothetical protein GCM10011514_54650 [Emticicia aquatilis]
MKLTAAQIEELYAFTRKKYVEYYDVQTELVDHLASSIEEKMSTSNINFETALQQVYTQFGIFGFSDLVGQKEMEVAIKGRNLFRKSFVGYFKLPKILLLLMIFLVSYKAFQIASLASVIYSFYALIIIFNIILISKIILIKRSIKLPLLQFKNIYILSSSVGSYLLMLQVFFNLSLSDLANWYPIALPIIFSFITISYLAEIDVLDKLSNQQRRLYPEDFK